MKMSWMRTRGRPYLMVAEVCQVCLHPRCEHHRSVPVFFFAMLFSKHDLSTNEFRDEGARAVTDAMEATRALRANVRRA